MFDPCIRRGSSILQSRASKFQGIFEDEIGDSMVHQMLDVSEFAYKFAELRGIVRDNDIERGSPEKDEGVKFNSPELIITGRGPQPKDQNRLLNYPITVPAIEKFVELNRCFLSENADGFYFDDKTKPDLPATSKDFPKLRLEVELEKYMSLIDSELLDFDDKITTDGGLVYTIVKNKTNKRFTVGFRGTAGLKDIITDGKFAFKQTPEIFEKTQYKPKMHRGFASYLFDNRTEVHEGGTAVMRSSFDRIVASLKDSFEELDEDDRNKYDICVTGHSLGGALANLFAYGIAEIERDCSFFDKILAMTFASPVVGGKSYNEAFQALEKQGRLRHIRISNESDLIPTQPYPFYTQNGVNLHLRKNRKMDHAYRNTKVVFSQLSFDPLPNHGLKEYEKRLFSIPENKSILEKSIAELYREAGDFTN
eukprot:CAMPEP_0194357660 /NCGR_PEP_ID=MMETSP0174-20130528/5112_1 /TAXON_ID=216777 /ORGANISM="Proboscia alata, Strain PI-D3" /LENGTH=422 /DNA_ID=CAMNT_0039127775 /DNA_START=367 /DNA_END=1635 /DNA_ORIENTATION=-